MQVRLLALLIGLVSNPCAAEDPYGSFAKEIWEGEGNEKFYAIINPRRMQTISSKEIPIHWRGSKSEIQRRYKNGIGQNVVTIPKGQELTTITFDRTGSAGIFEEGAGIAGRRRGLSREARRLRDPRQSSTARTIDSRLCSALV